jgi:hypothetical protein
MEVPVCVSDKPPEILCTIDVAVRDLEEDGCEGIVEVNKIIVGLLSNDGEEG